MSRKYQTETSADSRDPGGTNASSHYAAGSSADHTQGNTGTSGRPTDEEWAVVKAVDALVAISRLPPGACDTKDDLAAEALLELASGRSETPANSELITLFSHIDSLPY